MIDPVYNARVTQANRLSAEMVQALMTADLNGKPVEGDTRSLNALSHITRRLIDEYGVLTERGQIVFRALRGEQLSEEESARIFPVPVGRYFVEGNDIRPYSEAVNGETALSLGDAKSVILAGLRAEMKRVRAIKASDINKGAEDDVPEAVDTEEQFS